MSQEYKSAKGRRDRLRLRFGLTEEQFVAQLLAQDKKCAACGTSEPGGPWRLFLVDHDHACCPGQVSCGNCIRELLCTPCNITLGIVNDSVERLTSLIAYLLKHQKMQATNVIDPTAKAGGL